MACVGVTSAHAQATRTQSSSVEEIVVTAQRREEALQDVPISITAVSSATLEKSGITRLEDLTRISAGVQIARTGIFTQPAIRGITTAQGNFAENNVALYIDGFYIPSARGLNTELANISQVTVLKGPQGTLFGRNATGGAILIETLQPSLTTRSGRLSASVGNFADRRIQGYFSTPITDKLAINLTGSYRQSDGYIKDVRGFNTAPLKIYSLAAKILYAPTDKLDFTLSAGTSEVSDGRSLASTAVGRTLALFQFPTSYVETRPYRTSLTHPVTNRTFQNYVSVKGRYDLGWATLSTYTFHQFEASDLYYEANDASALVLFDSFSNERWRTFTQEVNLTSKGDGRFQYVLGGYYFNARQKSPKDTYGRSFPATAYTVSTKSAYNTEAFAVYADGTLEAVDHLFLTVGVRYNHEKKRALFVPPPTYVPVAVQANADSVTPRAVIRYQLADNTNVYGSFSKGFKSAVINSVNPFNAVLPEKVTAFEVGFKTVQSGFRFDTAAYHYNYKNLQVATIAVINNTQSSIVTNAAQAEIYGAEAQISAHPVSQLNVSAGLAYTHARYKSYPTAVVSIPGANGLNSANCANPNPPPATRLCTQDQSGLRMLRAPDWSANLNADYTIPIPVGSLVLSGNVSYQSFHLTNRSDVGLNGQGYRYGQPGFALLALQAAWKSPDERFKLSVYGNNVTDKKYRIVYNGTAFSDYEVLGEPATYGARIDYSF
jgi:iron complex outermembrane receptor protein